MKDLTQSYDFSKTETILTAEFLLSPEDVEWLWKNPEADVYIDGYIYKLHGDPHFAVYPKKDRRYQLRFKLQ